MVKSAYSKTTGGACNRCGISGSRLNAIRISPWWDPNLCTYKYLCEDCIAVVNVEIGQGMY